MASPFPQSTLLSLGRRWNFTPLLYHRYRNFLKIRTQNIKILYRFIIIVGLTTAQLLCTTIPGISPLAIDTSFLNAKT